MTPKPNKDIFYWMTWNIWNMKKYSIPKSKWRSKLADMNAKRPSPFPAVQFIDCWHYLKKEGLI